MQYQFQISHLLKNTDEYEWDPNVFALHRRCVHFICPENNDDVISMLNILKGCSGQITKQRLYYSVSDIHRNFTNI